MWQEGEIIGKYSVTVIKQRKTMKPLRSWYLEKGVLKLQTKRTGTVDLIPQVLKHSLTVETL